MSDQLKEIIGGLNNKAALKQHIYRNTLATFKEIRSVASEIAGKVAPEVVKKDPNVEVELTKISEFEFHLKFSGDTIAFIMHTNVFTFPPEHEISKTKYVQETPEYGYFGMIQAYNFLSDSIKYHRLADIGYLLARLFINADGHFYIDGQRQLDFLYKDLASNEINSDVLLKLIEQTMLYALDFDLYAPPVDAMSEISLEQKNYFNSPSGLATGKRLGFKSPKVQ